MRKRSQRVALCIVGAAAFALAGCREEEVDAQAFPDLQSCKSAAATGATNFSAIDCEAAYQEVQKIHVESAPRYDSLQVCEQEHGVGSCGDEQQASGGGGGGGGGIFMPLLTGYLIGNMLSRGVGSTVGQPLYRKAGGQFTNATGTSSYSSNAGKAKLGATQFAKPPATIGKAPMTKTSVASRGGFGSTSASRGSFGG
ncbi:DUF1190 domain-containing protein [Pseudogemmobacter sp. W21_MBD1_M6]|uniref:DUF1190 domain-containing protein n=1 Tax=Pseudogemmobacter sp. W21_MBD1_M6 TaxID=3240271 RepID=UPI003F9D7E53